MATRLRQLLWSLCLNTEWNYAVFWKLRIRVPMVLTCEDAYYDNHFEHDTSVSKIFSDVLETWHDCHFAHDPLGLAVAKMSYHVYSHGEGIVGQVAVMGNHRWILAGDHPMNSFPSPELCDGWQTQLSVGIKTVVVVAVPHGVVQLGSLSEVNEDLKLLFHIRNLFSSLQDSSTCHVQNPFQCSMQSTMQMSDTSTMSLHPDALQEYILDLEKSRLSLPDNFDSAACNTAVVGDEDHLSEEKLRKLFTSDMLEKQKAENNAEIQPQCDLYKGSCEVEKTEDSSTSNIPEIIESSMLTSASDNLLEAIVAKSCLLDASVKNRESFSTSESMLTTEKNPESYMNTSHTVGSCCYSIDCSSVQEEGRLDCFKSSESCSVRSSTSACREPMARPIELGKSSKKRARPGGSSRPRPRDRQLIEDRIKELRKLVPNGSKCSIDSLLERTIKHMVSLQNAKTNANCTKSRGCSNETRMLASGYEQGSCWAVEVGCDMKISPVVVENLITNGQMLIEMLCEDCYRFLEIAEAVRSLGLTILKGSTENRGDKIWMRFVVKGQGNRIPHRMEVLWSLLQLLQSETTA